MGSIKTGVVESSSAEDGLDAARSEGGALQSRRIFRGLDNEGKEVNFRLHVSISAGQQSLIVIKQIPID